MQSQKPVMPSATERAEFMGTLRKKKEKHGILEDPWKAKVNTVT
jgi:hypothetical protein